MKTINFKYLLLLILLFGTKSFAQVISISNNTGETIIQKSTVQLPSIPTGEPFNYSIDFQNLDQTKTLSISDVLPQGLCYSASDIVADASFLDFSGNVVSNPNSIPGLIDTSNLPTVTFNIPNNVQRGSFTITVRFCGGITEDGFSVTNNICATYSVGNTNDETFCSSMGLTSTASAINPWGNITKEPLFPAVLGSDGNYYMPTPGGIVNYKIRIEKEPQYASSVFGMLNLTDVSITELFSSCATVTLVSGPGTINTATNSIDLNNDLNGNVPNESAEFIISVDYSGCTFTDGQIVPNTVELNGTPVGETPLTNISSGTANVIAVDNLPAPNLDTAFTKTVEVFNPVPGCLGKYIISVVNNDNRPISFLEISDQLPIEIQPQNINISGLINSASTSDTFDLSVNNGSSTQFPMVLGYSSNPTIWNSSTNNSFSLIADSNTLLYPGDMLQIVVSFTMNSGIQLGSTITNCAHFEGAIIDVPNNINISLNEDSCSSFTIESSEVKLCAVKTVRKANTNDVFVTDITNVIPTDELEFQICVQNNGSMDFNGQLVDVLDARYEFVSVVSSNMPSGTTFNQNGQTLTWSNIDLFQTCSSFSGDYGCINPSNQSYCVTIKVKVKPFTPSGNIDNNATLSGANSNPFTTEYAKVNVIESSVLKFEKEISEDLTNFSQSLTFNPTCGNSVYYKMTVTNLGNKDVLQYQIIDELPAVNDVYFPTILQRTSSFSFASVIDDSSPDFTVSYLNTAPSSTNTPTNFDCSTVTTGNPTSSSMTQTILYESINSLAIGGSSEIIIEAILPSVTSLFSGDKAINSAYLVNCSPDGNIVIPTNMVELNIDAPVCTPLNFSPFTIAVPDLFPLAVEQELSVNRDVNKDKEYGDIDNDGDVDILFSKKDNSTQLPVLYWLENTAGPSNSPIYNLPSVNLNILNARSYRLYDWNNDGCNDIVILGWNAGVVVFINDCNASFTFGSYLLYDLIDYKYADELLMDIGDLNNDGMPDIVISGQHTASPGTIFYEHNGSNVYPFYNLPSPQNYISNGNGVTNPFIPENNGSIPTPEIYDADCDGDLDLFISDPLLPAPNYGGARMYFHENNGGVTNNTLPNVNVIGVSNQFGFLDDPNSSGYNSPLRCDWIITRIVDYFGNGCPIAISYNPCSQKFYYYLQEDCLCPDFYLLSIDDVKAYIKDTQLVLYPNPSSSTIHISGGNQLEFNYVIFDIQGRKMNNGTYSQGNSIDISNYTNGVYLIKLYQGNKEKTLKFIKQ